MDILNLEICPDCKADKKIFYPRNVDVQCLECGVRLCGGHISSHLEKIHLISLNLDHCRR